MFMASPCIFLLLVCAVASIAEAAPRPSSSSPSIFADDGNGDGFVHGFEPWYQCVNFQVKSSMQGIVDRCNTCVLSPESVTDQDCSACCGGSLGTNQYLLCESGQSCCVRMLGRRARGRVFATQPYLDEFDDIETNTCSKFFLETSSEESTCGNQCALGVDASGTKRLDCSSTGYLLPNAATEFSPTSECASPREQIMSRLNASSESAAASGFVNPIVVPLSTARNSTGSESDGNCFPGGAAVELASGETCRMDNLKTGDIVKVGPGLFSNVFMFTHKDPSARASFTILSTLSKNVIKVTPGHYLYANKKLVPAGEVRFGDFLMLENGSESMVEKVQTVCDAPYGIFNPQTVHGDIVVNGIVASTYTTTVDPTIAHAVLLPMRVIHRLSSVSWRGLEGDSIWRQAALEYSNFLGSFAHQR